LIGENRKRFSRDRASFPAAKNAVLPPGSARSYARAIFSIPRLIAGSKKRGFAAWLGA
jgi:hypothetical protein